MIQSLALPQASYFPLCMASSFAREQLCLVVARADLRLDRESCTFYSNRQVKKLGYPPFTTSVWSPVLAHCLHLGQRGHHTSIWDAEETLRSCCDPYWQCQKKKQERTGQWQNTISLLLRINSYSLGEQLDQCKAIACLPSLVLPLLPPSHTGDCCIRLLGSHLLHASLPCHDKDSAFV